MGQGHIREGGGGEGDSLPCLILPLLDSCKSATCMHPVAGSKGFSKGHEKLL